MSRLTSSNRAPSRFLVLAGALTLGIPNVAFADPSEADMAQARELLGEGLDLRGKGDAVGALDKLKAAHALVHTPITGLELGQTYLALGKIVEAREVFLFAAHLPVQSRETSRSGAARAQSEALAEQLRSRVPSLRIKVTGVSPDSIALTIDGTVIPTGALEAPRFVDPGSHLIVAQSTAGRTAEARVDLREGESRDVELKIVLTEGHAPEAPTASSAAPPLATHPAESAPSAAPALSPALTWSLIAGGGAIGVAGGVLMGVESARSHDAINSRDRAAFDSARTPWTVGLVGAVAGGVAVCGGVVLATVSSSKRASSAWQRPRIGLGVGLDRVHVGGSW
jgi:hypothetical protein